MNATTERHRIATALHQHGYQLAGQLRDDMTDEFTRDTTTVKVTYIRNAGLTHAEAATITYGDHTLHVFRSPRHNLDDHSRRLAYQAADVDPTDESSTALVHAIAAAAAQPAQLANLFQQQLAEHVTATRSRRPVRDEEAFAAASHELVRLAAEIDYTYDRDTLEQSIAEATELLATMAESLHPPTCDGCRAQHRPPMRMINWDRAAVSGCHD